MAKDKTKQIVCYVADTYWHYWHAVINATGIKDSPWLAGRIFIRGLMTEIKIRERQGELTPDEKLYSKLLQKQVRADEQSILEWLVTRCGDEDEADELASIAKEAGLDIDAAKEKAKDDNPFKSAICYDTNPETAQGQCNLWLSKLFTDHGELPRTEVMRLASLEGFKEYAVKRAKKILGIGDEKRTRGTWWWISPKINRNSNNNNNTNHVLLNHVSVDHGPMGGLPDRGDGEDMPF